MHCTIVSERKAEIFDKNGGIQHQVGHDQDEEVDQHTEGEVDEGGGDALGVNGDDGDDGAIGDDGGDGANGDEGDGDGDVNGDDGDGDTIGWMILRRRAVTWVQSLKKMRAPFLEVFLFVNVHFITMFNHIIVVIAAHQRTLFS